MSEPKVAVLIGSDSDWPTMKVCVERLQSLGIGVDVQIASAHRTPDRVAKIAQDAHADGISVIIAGAGMAAALAGAVAAHTRLPVIGVPIASGPLQGVDALFSTLQMPPGIPVATVGIGQPGAINAAILAAQIISVTNQDVADRLAEQRAYMARSVAEKNANLQSELRSPSPKPADKPTSPTNLTSSTTPAAKSAPADEQGDRRAGAGAPETKRTGRLAGGMSISVGHSVEELPGEPASQEGDPDEARQLADLAEKVSESDLAAIRRVLRRFQQKGE